MRGLVSREIDRIAEVIHDHYPLYCNERECETGKSVGGWAAHVAAEIVEHASWDLLMAILDRHYPEDIFPTMEDFEERDPGPRILSLIRRIHEIRKGIAR